MYSTPFLHNVGDHCTPFLIVCSTDGGIYIINASSGQINTRYKLDGEIFSSPVAVNDHLLVGCRNDYTHALQLIHSV